MEAKDFEDIKLARPVAIVDLWNIEDRIERLEQITERLEKAVRALLTLYHEERVRSWELILQEVLNRKDRRDGYKTKTY